MKGRSRSLLSQFAAAEGTAVICFGGGAVIDGMGIAVKYQTYICYSGIINPNNINNTAATNVM